MSSEHLITGETRIAGIFGDPVAHSLSPLMHNAAYAEQDLDWAYVPFHVVPERLASAVAAVGALNLAGVNVTIPHKVAIVPHLHEVDQSARLIGAVNTVVNRNGALIGYNTDGAGFSQSLRMEAGFEAAGKRVLLVGAGGAARAIGVQLALEAAQQVDVANRTLDRATALTAFLTKELGVTSRPYALEDLTPATTEPYDLIVHTTSWGMEPNAAVPPLLMPTALHAHTLVADIVYTPQDTSLLQAARERGCAVLAGLGMLVYQAALAYELWTGRGAPVDVMYNVLREQLAQRNGSMARG